MSGAGTGAATGAVSGAAAGTAVMPGWGTLIGAGIGGISGYLGGSGADAQAKAQAAALKRLKAAQAKYTQQTTGLAQETGAAGRGLDDEWMAAMRSHLQQYPDANAAFPAAQASWMGTQQQATAPALQPFPEAGMGGAEQGYLRRLAADRNARATEGMLPAAFQGAYGDMGATEHAYTQALQLQQAGIDQRLGRTTRHQQLQSQLNYEPYMAALRQYEKAVGKASTAGSGKMLAGGLVGAGGNMLASYGLNNAAAKADAAPAARVI